MFNITKYGYLAKQKNQEKESVTSDQHSREEKRIRVKKGQYGGKKEKINRFSSRRVRDRRERIRHVRVEL